MIEKQYFESKRALRRERGRHRFRRSFETEKNLAQYGMILHTIQDLFGKNFQQYILSCLGRTYDIDFSTGITELCSQYNDTEISNFITRFLIGIKSAYGAEAPFTQLEVPDSKNSKIKPGIFVQFSQNFRISRYRGKIALVCKPDSCRQAFPQTGTSCIKLLVSSESGLELVDAVFSAGELAYYFKPGSVDLTD